MKQALVLLLACAVAACSTPETRLRAGLVKAGLSKDDASCMADYMAQQLSIAQLRRLQSVVSIGEADYRRTTLGEYLRKVKGVEDGELLAVTTKAALVCTL